MLTNNVKGTHDIIGEESNGFAYIENVLKQICELFAYNEVRPPVMEHSELFVRGVGEGSDIVRKEMYTFNDKADRSITLRPEFTAGIMRLIVQNKLKEKTKESLTKYGQADLRMLMATGDNILTAICVSKECNLIRKNQEMFSC